MLVVPEVLDSHGSHVDHGDLDDHDSHDEHNDVSDVGDGAGDDYRSMCVNHFAVNDTMVDIDIDRDTGPYAHRSDIDLRAHHYGIGLDTGPYAHHSVVHRSGIDLDTDPHAHHSVVDSVDYLLVVDSVDSLVHPDSFVRFASV